MRQNEDLLGTEKKTLYETFYEHLPNHRGKSGRDTINIRKIGDDLGISFQVVGRWCNKNIIPSPRIDALCNLEGSTLTRDILLNFIRYS